MRRMKRRAQEDGWLFARGYRREHCDHQGILESKRKVLVPVAQNLAGDEARAFAPSGFEQACYDWREPSRICGDSSGRSRRPKHASSPLR